MSVILPMRTTIETLFEKCLYNKKISIKLFYSTDKFWTNRKTHGKKCFNVRILHVNETNMVLIGVRDLFQKHQENNDFA